MSENLPYNDIEQLSSNDKDKSIKINNNDNNENALTHNISIGKEMDQEQNDSIYINNEPKEKNKINESQKNAEIVYPTNLYSSLSFNWLYSVIKNRTEDNPVKLDSLGDISPSIQSKFFFNEIMNEWSVKTHKKLKIKKNGHSLFMTLLATNKKKLITQIIKFINIKNLQKNNYI
jgi:hypothetical protein